jgi:hypothetical protein
LVTASAPDPSVTVAGGIVAEPSRKPYHPWPAMLGTTCIFQSRKFERSRRTVMVLRVEPVGAEMMAPAGMDGAEAEANARWRWRAAVRTSSRAGTEA